MTAPLPSPKPSADPPSASPVDATEGERRKSASGVKAYNIVSDTVVGVNFRQSDNVFQLKVILVCLAVGVPLGALAGVLLAEPQDRLLVAFGGGLGLGFVGVVLGLFGSGIYLMVYRAVRHLKGKHD